MSYKRRHGKNGRMIVNGQILDSVKYDITWQGTDDDATSMEDGGFETGLVGIQSAQCNCTANWNAAANMFDSPPGIYPRDDGPEIKLYLNLADSTAFDFPVTRILNAKQTVGAKEGVIRFEFEFKNQGAFTAPTGSV